METYKCIECGKEFSRREVFTGHDLILCCECIRETTVKNQLMKKGLIAATVYCKIYAENFPTTIDGNIISGQELYDFLIDSCGCTEMEGDLNIWYIGSNEKHGCLMLNDRIWEWGWGDSSFITVLEFIQYAYEFEALTFDQLNDLIEKIIEGHKIGGMYHIDSYLELKSDGRERDWVNPERNWKQISKKFFSNVLTSINQKIGTVMTSSLPNAKCVAIMGSKKKEIKDE